MPTQLESTGTQVTTTQGRHPAVPALSFVALVAVLNGAVNGVVGSLQSVQPATAQFEYAITVPLGPPGAGLLSLGTGLLAIVSLALFVRSVGGTENTDRNRGTVRGTGELYGRALAVGIGGSLAFAIGLALLVVPGLVVLTYLPFVFVGVVLDGRTISGALKASHARIASSPGAVVARTVGTALILVGIGVGGVVTSILPPAVEFAVGGVGTAVVALAGTYLLTGLYRRLPEQRTASSGGL